MRCDETSCKRSVAATDRLTYRNAYPFQLPRCQKLLKKSCIDTFDAINCRGAVGFCEDNLSYAFASSGERLSSTLGTLHDIES